MIKFLQATENHEINNTNDKVCVHNAVSIFTSTLEVISAALITNNKLKYVTA